MTFTTKAKASSRVYVDAYRQLTGRRNIPKNRQHISLLAGLSGHPLEEPKHLAELGFVKPNQVVGIERDPEIYAQQLEANAKHYGGTLSLHQGEAITVLEHLALAGTLRPATVNLDLMCSASTGLPILVQALNILAECAPTILVSWNVMLHHNKYTQINAGCWREAMKDPSLSAACRWGSWQTLSPYCDYTGHDAYTTMRTTMFWKNT